MIQIYYLGRGAEGKCEQIQGRVEEENDARFFLPKVYWIGNNKYNNTSHLILKYDVYFFAYHINNCPSLIILIQFYTNNRTTLDIPSTHTTKLISFLHEDVGPSEESTPSGCCNHSTCVHPQAASPRRWDAADREGCPPYPGSLPWRCQWYPKAQHQG